MKHITHPPVLYGLIGLHIFLGLGGIYGGISFITDPTGASMGMPQRYLDNLPINDYLLPGLFLLSVFGFLPLFLAYALWQKPTWLGVVGHQHSAWAGTLALGIVLMLWMVGQIILIGFQHPIQGVTIVVGILLLVFILLPQTRTYYQQGG